MTEHPVCCATCNQPLGGKYCAHCGEKRVEPGDHTLIGFCRHVFVAFAHADGKIFLTLRYLLLRPGRLTADYVRGRRKPYIPPLELFLIGNLIFFLLHPLIGSNTLTTDLNTHLHYTWHQTIARSLVTPRLAVRGMTADAYAAVFNPASVTQAKSLVILVVPIFALAVMALYGRQQRHYVVHLVFSLHFCTLWLLLTCTTLALTNLTMRLLRSVRMFPTAENVNQGIIVFSLVIMTGYLFCAVRTVFAPEATWVTALKALLLGLALNLSLEAYRCVLFFITFWST
ncbi:MAG: DUF3667 domain-containing protein [Opitutales bacterium]